MGQLTTCDPASGARKVTFEATGTGGAKNATNVTYNVDLDIKQEARLPLPDSNTVSVGDDATTVSLWVQNADAKVGVTFHVYGWVMPTLSRAFSVKGPAAVWAAQQVLALARVSSHAGMR
ncbi:hypothetical protein Pth03_45050 [Planotetraspora thailandica]|uniref:Uncharacterized protein n=1 Tax=Planotetraspora thailandica TaxID=487172 RepID=A0A8J3V717_9ACTN|nr:hypothetical protein [Planotetraspora thailandica]GII56116.1 hypothetical protein Pth03_45050 [Planotetraspora thailandica]